MIVVLNSSPLITLAKIGKLNILKELFDKITTSKAVWVEVVENGKGKLGAKEIEKASWIKVEDAKDKLGVEILKGEVEVGEAEAIVLARELEADLLVIDERIPRIIAKSLGLKVVGSLAILYIAKKKGLIEEEFDELLKELRLKGIRFSDDVLEKLRQMYGE